MAGHSKWANIKFRKAAQDAKRGNLFSKLIKEISVAARMGGGDLDANPRLRAAVDKALAANMTRQVIDRALKRGSGDVDGAVIEEILYEGYGPAGLAILVECATDNRNRAASEIRHAFAKHGGNLGTSGSVAYLFSKIGSLVFSANADQERIMELALQADADDIDLAEDMIEVTTSPQNYLSTAQQFKEAGHSPQLSELIWRPSTYVELRDGEAEKATKLLDGLEQLDDVQNVFSNAIFVTPD